MTTACLVQALIVHPGQTTVKHTYFVPRLLLCLAPFPPVPLVSGCGITWHGMQAQAVKLAAEYDKATVKTRDKAHQTFDADLRAEVRMWLHTQPDDTI